MALRPSVCFVPLGGRAATGASESAPDRTASRIRCRVAFGAVSLSRRCLLAPKKQGTPSLGPTREGEPRIIWARSFASAVRSRRPAARARSWPACRGGSPRRITGSTRRRRAPGSEPGTRTSAAMAARPPSTWRTTRSLSFCRVTPARATMAWRAAICRPTGASSSRSDAFSARPRGSTVCPRGTPSRRLRSARRGRTLPLPSRSPRAGLSAVTPWPRASGYRRASRRPRSTEPLLRSAETIAARRRISAWSPPMSDPSGGACSGGR